MLIGMPATPNVIVTLIDDLRFDECGIGGHPSSIGATQARLTERAFPASARIATAPASRARASTSTGASRTR